MNVAVALKDLRRTGESHLAARRFDAAAEVLEEAASLSEVPRGGLVVKLARAYLEAGRPERASARLMDAVVPAASYKTLSAAAGLLARCPIETWPSVRRQIRVGLVGTWTTSTFAPLLRLAAARLGIVLTIHEPSFGQYFTETLDPYSALHAEKLDALILCPDHRALGLPPFSNSPAAEVEAALDRWAGVWRTLRQVSQAAIVQMGFAAPGADPLGHYGAGLPGTRRRMIAAINEGLAGRAAAADVSFVDLARLAAEAGESIWFDPRGWYMAKIPYGPDALAILARHTAAVLAARLGLSRRCLVLDLDNTLWGGVIGDDGLEGIVLGGSTMGEAFVDFQMAIKELPSRGVVLAVASKNDPDVARRPFIEHPEMVLKLEDFAAFEANWGPKSESIRRVAEKLNFGLESLTFFDDNPYERAEVRRALPAVDVPVLPEEPLAYRQALESYPHFEPATFTEADQGRAEQYRARAQAEALRAEAGSIEEYQASLNMAARIGPLDAVNMSRVVQLINKTNQFNLTTRRRNQAELEVFLEREEAEAFWVRLSDKFADHGLIAVVLAEVRGETLAIDTFLMSCRVLGRGVEAVILAEIARRAQVRGCRKVEGVYLPSGRNGMVAELYARHGMIETAREADGRTVWAAAPEELATVTVPIAVELKDSRVGAG